MPSKPSGAGIPKVILHVDLDAFFCSVEELLEPTIKGTPFVVGGDPGGRGVVSSASYPARAYGVRNAMPTSQALRLCPHLIVVPVHRESYSTYSNRVMMLLQEYGPQFEQVSVDEAYLDITGLAEDSYALALEIQARIRAEHGLPASVGIASGKTVAKMASNNAKPNGIRVIKQGEEQAFLAPMAVEQLIGIGNATTARLNQLKIFTIGQLIQANPIVLRKMFGDHVEDLLMRARGVDHADVKPEHEAKSISTERTFARDIGDETTLRVALLAMSDEVAERLRAEGVYARTVHLKMRWPDFTTMTRQAILPVATQLADDIFVTIEKQWRGVWRDGQRVRLIGIGVSDLRQSEEQMPIFDFARREQLLALARVTDTLRAKYGKKIIGRASLKKKRL